MVQRDQLCCHKCPPNHICPDHLCGDRTLHRPIASLLGTRDEATTKDTDSDTVCPVSGTGSYSPQDRLRRLLAAVWQQTHPY